ncbi:phosphatase PAP2 family protein (plasmid) [Priestia megaterium]|jgi:undecaprenyl-diphosphatase|nr:phosphatase PAP2 family protein [Priestia megaterium]KOP63661.1 hypothetical protein AMS61_29880 [Bacillus sp. FJAT-21351]MCJ7983258.1 phosphatase PAP2 family protein [Priestia sp. OVL9]USL27885.1 phosphatase PAP2 family protein [Priestia megaterium]WDM31744.1 phosphatase PAP2 family protein [Priestia megaterium]
MNLKSPLMFTFILSLLSIIGFSFMATLISKYNIIQFDSTVISFIQGFESPTLTMIMKFFSFIGSTSSVIVLSLFILFFLYKVLHHRSELILFIGVVLGSSILNLILKLFFHRARPDLHRLIEIHGYSFPSGHAMSAFAVYGVLSFLLWRHIPTRSGRSILTIISITMIILIGISRIYLGVHYPSDIIGGYLASGFWLTLAIWFYQRYQEKLYKQKHSSES